MSTFDGIIKEFPLISIDSFLPNKNYASTVYFLSHCHADHMHGLADGSFFKHLKSRSFSKIYLSDVSSHLLKNDSKYQHLADYLVGLPIEQPTIIILYDEDGKTHSRVVVTLLTAGHCPGSVMVLIEGENGRILYTGDFRLPIGSSARLTHMHENDGSLKALQSLYIDTTFCNNKCLFIPSREECLSAIVSLVEPWIFKGPNYIVCIFCPAQYAYEFVFVELYKRYGVKTHVTAEREKKYIGIKSIEDAITSFSPEARIHACTSEESGLLGKDFYEKQTPCGYFSPDEKPVRVLKIKPSAMFFQRQKFTDISRYDYRAKMYRVCYSTHPSLSEIRDMFSYLKPKEVFPNVVRKQTEKEILDLIYRNETYSSPEAILEELTPSLGQLKSPQIKEPSKGHDTLPFYDECYEIKKQQKTLAHSSKETSRLCEDLHIETDFENTEEQEIMLKEEIFFQQKKVGEHSKFVDKFSPLKWQNPIVSSEDEIFECSSSSGGSIKDKIDSDMDCGTSGENKPMSLNEEDEEMIRNNNKDEKIPALSRISVNKTDFASAHKSEITNNLPSKNGDLIASNAQGSSLRFSPESNLNLKSSSSLISDFCNFQSRSKQSHKVKNTKHVTKNLSSSRVRNCHSKSFGLVRKINYSGYSSEEDDENSFKHIVKLKKPDISSSDSDEHAFHLITKLPKESNDPIKLSDFEVSNRNVHSNGTLSFINGIDHLPRHNFIKQDNVSNIDVLSSKCNENINEKKIEVSSETEIKNCESQFRNISHKTLSVNQDPKKDIQVMFGESKFNDYKSDSDSKLQTISNCSNTHAAENAATKLNQPECAKTQNIFEDLFLTSSDEMNVPCSKIQNPSPENKIHSCTNKYANKIVNDASKSNEDPSALEISSKEECNLNNYGRSNHSLRTNLENSLLTSSREMNESYCKNKTFCPKNIAYSSTINITHESAVELADLSVSRFSYKKIQDGTNNTITNQQSEESTFSKCDTNSQKMPDSNYIDNDMSVKFNQHQKFYNSHVSVYKFNSNEVKDETVNVRTNHQVESGESQLSEYRSRNDLQLQTMPVYNDTDKNISTRFRQSQEFHKSPDIFEEILHPSSDEITSSAHCSKNHNFSQETKPFSCSTKSICEISVNNAHTAVTQCIVISSDSSNEDICFLGSSVPTTNQMSRSMEVKFKKAEISLISSDCSNSSCKGEKPQLSEPDFPKYTAADLKCSPLSNGHKHVTSGQKSCLQNIPQIIVSSSESEVSTSFCNLNSSTSAEKTEAASLKAHKETNIPCINKTFISSENNETSWKNKCHNQSTHSDVEDIDPSSDLDDSPSLIAPILKVSKVTEADCDLHSNSNGVLNPKRRKTDCKNFCSFTQCFDSLTKNHKNSDRHLKASDSTPEDLIENSNLVANSNLSFKRKIPEIIIDDDKLVLDDD